MTLAGDGSAPLLRVAGLRTYFRTAAGIARAVDGVNLAVGRGEIHAVVGESGSGKSVTALSILRLVEWPGEIQRDSQILFEGEDLMRRSPRRMRAIRGGAIAMIGQRPMSALNPVRSIGAQGIEAMRLHLGLSRRAATARIVELMGEVGIGEPEQRLRAFPHELSGGLAQRVAIAMALSCQPRLLIADEPTTALDVTIQANLLARLRTLRDRSGMAIIFITHDLGLVANVADTVTVMYGGKDVESGTTAQVLAGPAHPYTRALLHSIPRIGMHYDQTLPTIPGRVPPATAWPVGCRFQPRCAEALARCAGQPPPRIEPGPGRTSLCWLDGDGQPLEREEVTV